MTEAERQLQEIYHLAVRYDGFGSDFEETVAQAITAAEQRGYERGLEVAEQVHSVARQALRRSVQVVGKGVPYPPEPQAPDLHGNLGRAKQVIAELEKERGSLWNQCKDLAIHNQKYSREICELKARIAELEVQLAEAVEVIRYGDNNLLRNHPVWQKCDDFLAKHDDEVGSGR